MFFVKIYFNVVCFHVCHCLSTYGFPLCTGAVAPSGCRFHRHARMTLSTAMIEDCNLIARDVLMFRCVNDTCEILIHFEACNMC